MHVATFLNNVVVSLLQCVTFAASYADSIRSTEDGVATAQPQVSEIMTMQEYHARGYRNAQKQYWWWAYSRESGRGYWFTEVYEII